MSVRKKIDFGGFIILLLIYLLQSCNSDELILGENFIDNTTQVVEVDTFSLAMSTIIADSVQTSATGTILAGYYEDGDFGKLSAQGFFRVGLPTATDIEIEEADIFDSITLVLPYSGYTYGDTNQIQKIDIYKLNEDLVKDDISYYYNYSDLSFDNNSIGSIEYLPRPYRDSIIEIRLDDAIGDDLFEKLKYETEEVSSYDEFLDYLQGFTIKTDQSQSSSIVGFKNYNIKLKIYTSRVQEEKEEIVYEFSSSDQPYHFSRLLSDRSGTILQDLIAQKDELSSNLVDDKSFIQGGTGVLTKITFPYLNSLYFDEDDIITSVEIILIPDNESYETDLPESLSIYETNKFNEFDIADDNSFISTSIFNLDEQYHLDTYYYFNITDFIQDQLDNGYIDPEKGLIVSLSSSTLSSTFEKLLLSSSNDPEKKPKLKITFLKF
jgi:Domain of unknown function (DUF4270)